MDFDHLQVKWKYFDLFLCTYFKRCDWIQISFSQFHRDDVKYNDGIWIKNQIWLQFFFKILTLVDLIP